MITIDAQNKKLGRVATQVVIALRGKDSASFTRNIDPQRDVEVVNVSKLDITAKKMRDTIYHSHSGFMGGVKKRTLGAIISKRGHAEALRKAVYGMLPSNKLRARMMKRLSIKA
jgi:large subunit ribosomal protein L13